MTIAEKLQELGRDEGRVEGRVEGRRDTLRELLALKFGPRAPEHEALIAIAETAQLERYLARTLTAMTVADVFAA